MTQENTQAAIAKTDSRRIEVVDTGEFQNLMDTGRSAQLWRMAQTFAASELVPVHFQNNPANCFIGLQMAIRMGVDPFMWMQNCYIVYGRPGMEAKLAIALINSSGLFMDSLDYEIIGDDAAKNGYKVRAFTTRKTTGKLVNGPWVDWGIVRAEGWDTKKGSKWMTMPAMMFQYRAATFFGRLHCPERLMGMQTVDELRDTGELPADRNVVSAGSISRTASLAAKIAGKPVSENQTFVPETDASENIDAQAAQQGETIDHQTGEVVAEPAKAPETTESGAAPPAGEVIPEPDGKVFLADPSWRTAMLELAGQLGLPEDATQAAIAAAAVKTPGVRMDKATRRNLWLELRDGTGNFDR